MKKNRSKADGMGSFIEKLQLDDKGKVDSLEEVIRRIIREKSRAMITRLRRRFAFWGA